MLVLPEYVLPLTGTLFVEVFPENDPLDFLEVDDFVDVLPENLPFDLLDVDFVFDFFENNDLNFEPALDLLLTDEELDLLVVLGLLKLTFDDELVLLKLDVDRLGDDEWKDEDERKLLPPNPFASAIDVGANKPNARMIDKNTFNFVFTLNTPYLSCLLAKIPTSKTMTASPIGRAKCPRLVKCPR